MSDDPKAFSLRVLFMAIMFGALCGGLASLAWHPLGPPTGIAAAALAWIEHRGDLSALRQAGEDRRRGLSPLRP